MRKPVFPRILLIALLYIVIFTALVFVQFAKQGSFTRKVGDFVVTGQYRLPGEEDSSAVVSTAGTPNEFLLDGDTHVFFGGMDFSMIKGSDGHSLMLAGIDGDKDTVLPERMIISGGSAVFVFPGGTELEFSTQYSGGGLLMLISGVFPENVTGVELPFKPLRKAGIKETGDGQFIVISDGVNYTFDHSPMDAEARVLFIRAGSVPVSYRAIPERKGFSPDEFILPQALTDVAYNDVITRWRDQNFSAWNRTISEQNDEDTIIAFAGEALVRGTYKAAVAAVPTAFLRGSSRTHESSVYLGGLEQASRSISSREREKIARLSRQINEKSLEFLKEPRVIEYFAVRGHFNFIEAGADLVRGIDPSVLALDITPGILEGYLDWNTYRPNTENPFERLVDQACFVISESIMKTTDASGSHVFVLNGGQGDTEFNLRLGKALLAYAETVQDNTWIEIGRSLVISALSAEDGVSPKLYRILNPVNTCPRAVAVVSSNNIWAWTAAQGISASQQSDSLDIAVRFPAGETHYMMIRGIRPFARIQLYGMDFRTDPQFERYDSSGWAYNAQEQTLLLKMKHRVTEEHVMIIFREAPRPEAAPEAAKESEAAPDSKPVTESESAAPVYTNNYFSRD